MSFTNVWRRFLDLIFIEVMNLMAMSSSINVSNVSKFLGLISICAQRNRFLGLVFISAFISAQRTSLLGLSMTLQISTP